jgi:hypothetical protein
MHKEKVTILGRIRLPEFPPQWSLRMAVFFIGAYIVLWIAGQIIASTLSGELAPSAGTLAFGALLGSLVTVIGIIQWAQRRLTGGWIKALRLFTPPDPPVFLIVLVGLGAAWALDLAAIILRLKGDQIVPPTLAALTGSIGPGWVAAAILAIVVQPIADGLVFAGIAYPALTVDLKNNILTTIATAFIYMLINFAFFSTGATSWYAFIQPFMMALVMILVRAYTQSTQSAIVARALFGLFFVLSALITMRA